MKIYIAGDHAGYKFKEKIKDWLSKKHKVIDLGPFEYDKFDDYPDFTIPLAEKVAKDKKSLGIVIAGSGIGECIAANKVKGIRAVSYHGKSNFYITTSKVHDDANVFCLGSRFMTEKEAKQAISLWIKTPFSKATRHKRRLGKIAKYERKHLR
jgi:ribose 5-phosphate isomerase B